MATFSDIPEVDSAIRCLRGARQKVVDLYGLTERNEWVTVPPPEVCEALQLLNAACSHLENLAEHGTASYRLVAS